MEREVSENHFVAAAKSSDRFGQLIEPHARTMMRITQPITRIRPQFKDRVALITGGTAGIGAATVRRMSELGANVLFTGRHVENAQRIIRDTERNPGKVVFVRADLSVPEEVRKVIPLVVSTFGRLDFAFNNTGTFGSMGALVDQSEEDFDQVFALNVKALFLLLQSELTLMLEQRSGGSIVNTASVNGMVAAPRVAPYVASKHAVLGLTKSAAIEYGKYGIRVNAVSPGAIRTQLLLDVFGSREALDDLGAAHPLRRIGPQRKSPKRLYGSFQAVPRTSPAKQSCSTVA